MRGTPFPNLFEINTLYTTMCSALKWIQSISGVPLMPLVLIRMCHKNVLSVQNNLQAVLQLQYFKIAVVVQGAGDGKQVLGELTPELAYVQGCRWVADMHHLCSDDEGLKSDLPPQIQACGYEMLLVFVEGVEHQLMARGQIFHSTIQTKLWVKIPRQQ